MRKNLFILLILIIFCLGVTIGSVSANENVTGDLQTNEIDFESKSTNYDQSDDLETADASELAIDNITYTDKKLEFNFKSKMDGVNHLIVDGKTVASDYSSYGVLSYNTYKHQSFNYTIVHNDWYGYYPDSSWDHIYNKVNASGSFIPLNVNFNNINEGAEYTILGAQEIKHNGNLLDGNKLTLVKGSNNIIIKHVIQGIPCFYNVNVNANSISTESISTSTLNPDVTIDNDNNFISIRAPSAIYDDLSLYIDGVKYGKSCDLNGAYGVIKNLTVKDKEGNMIATKLFTWSKLKFTLKGHSITLTSDEYLTLKKHSTIKKYVGIKKIKYVSGYKKVKKTYYKTKLLGKANKSKLGTLILASLIGVKNTVKYLKSINKKLSKTVNKNIKKMTKKGWKFDYSYKKTKYGIQKIYGEFYKVKKVKKPVYKYKQENNYMILKYNNGKYIMQVDSDDGKYVYTNTINLI